MRMIVVRHVRRSSPRYRRPSMIGQQKTAFEVHYVNICKARLTSRVTSAIRLASGSGSQFHVHSAIGAALRLRGDGAGAGT